MTSTRLAAPRDPWLGTAGTRDRVSPDKLLALIDRIRTASGSADTPAPTRQPGLAKAG